MTDFVNEDSPCNICNVLIVSDDNGLLCDGFCKQWYHPECVGINLENYKLITQVTNTEVVSNHIKWFCKPCAGKVDRLVASVSDVDDLINLRSVVDGLVSVVKGVIEDNLLLNKRMDDVTTEHNITKQKVQTLSEITPEVVKLSSAIPSKTDSIANQSKSDNLNHSEGISDLIVDCPGIESDTLAVKPVLSSATAPRVVDKDNLTSQSENNVNKSVRPSYASKVKSKPKQIKPNLKDRSTKPVIGTKVNESMLLTVEKKVVLFVSRLDPTVSKEQVIEYFKQANILSVECERLTSRYDSYSSFKIALPACHSDKVLNAEFWPIGTLVKRFIQKRKDSFVNSRVFLGKPMLNH